jgi:hypothetical protein
MTQEVSPDRSALARGGPTDGRFPLSYRHERLSAAAAGEHLDSGRAAVQACWLCGIRLPTSQLVADGDPARGDVRWYCQDTRSCTERWTARPAS